MAGRIALDLKAFKHVKSDKDSTTLEHRDGHQLVVAHKALSKEGRDQLSALSKIPQDAATVANKEEMKDKGIKMSDGGGVVDSIKQAADKVIKQTSDYHNEKDPEPYKNAKKQQPQPQDMYADGGKVKKSTIVSGKASHGIQTSNKAKQEGEEAPHGSTIMVLDPKEESKDYGKVKIQDEKPKKMADGGTPEALPADSQPGAEVMQQVSQVPTSIPDLSPEQVSQMREQQMNEEKAKLSPPGVYSQDPMLVEKAALNAIDKRKMRDEASVNYEASQKDVKAKQIDEINGQRVRLGMAPIPPSQTEQGPQPPGSPGNMPEASPDRLPQSTDSQQPMANMMANDPMAMMQQGYQNQMGGIQKEAAAQGMLGKEQEQILNQQVEAQNKAKASYQEQYNALDKERQIHMQDIQNGYIDPNKYWTGDKDGNGSHSKIMAGIGMILAGFNPTNQPNAAINFLTKQMDMNLDAQKQNLGAKQNLLNANLRQFGNLKDATDMTRLMQADVVHNQLLQAAAKATTPMAQASAMKAAGQLQMQYAPLQQQFAMRRAMMNLADSSNGNPSDTKAAEQMIAYARMTNPEMAKEMESRLIPGMGMAKVPVPEKVREQLTGFQKLQDTAKDLLQFTKTHTTINPLSKDYAVGEQKAKTLQAFIREGMLGTVYREGEQPLLDQFVNNNPAGAMKMLQTQPKLKELLNSSTMQMNALKKSYGLPQTQQSDPNQQALQWAKANKNDPRAAAILQHLGQK